MWGNGKVAFFPLPFFTRLMRRGSETSYFGRMHAEHHPAKPPRMVDALRKRNFLSQQMLMPSHVREIDW